MRIFDVSSVEGRRKLVARELGASAVKLNQFDSQPGQAGFEHDERESGQEEVYIALRGSGLIRVEGEEVPFAPGRYVLVSRAVEAGVFGYLVKPFREVDLLPAIQAARARHEELTALREQADSLAEALAARKSIERAKGLLMEREGLSEQEAFARLRKASQVSGRPLRVVADAVIATFGDSPP